MYTKRGRDLWITSVQENHHSAQALSLMVKLLRILNKDKSSSIETEDIKALYCTCSVLR